MPNRDKPTPYEVMTEPGIPLVHLDQTDPLPLDPGHIDLQPRQPICRVFDTLAANERRIVRGVVKNPNRSKQ